MPVRAVLDRSGDRWFGNLLTTSYEAGEAGLTDAKEAIQDVIDQM
jgi:hypothetical protein